MRKKFMAAISFFAAAFVLISLSAAASAYAGADMYEMYGFDKNQIALSKLLKSTMESFLEEEVDVSEYNVSFDEFEDVFSAVILNEPSLHYVDCTQISLSQGRNKKISSFKPVYHCSFFELEERNAKIEKFSKSVMSGIKKHWSDEEKILYVHERLAAHVTYYNGKDVVYGRNIYDAFADGSSVCVGYSLGFQYFMDKLGIPCVNVTTPDHIWNMVNVDGQWYHVDVTWDDSAEITKNTVFHNILLQSDEGIVDTDDDHGLPERYAFADDSFYSEAFWTQSHTRISYLSGYWYYTTMEGLYRYSFETGESRLLFSMDDIWYAQDDMEWKISFAQTAVYGNNVYFNSSDTIYRYDISRKKVYKVLSPKLSGDDQIFDLYISSSKLIFCTGDGNEPVKARKSIKLKASK